AVSGRPTMPKKARPSATPTLALAACTSTNSRRGASGSANLPVPVAITLGLAEFPSCASLDPSGLTKAEAQPPPFSFPQGLGGAAIHPLLAKMARFGRACESGPSGRTQGLPLP